MGPSHDHNLVGGFAHDRPQVLGHDPQRPIGVRHDSRHPTLWTQTQRSYLLRSAGIVEFVPVLP